MNNDYKNKGFKQLLDKLQQESWQLELLISGFAIFGLFTAFPHVETQLNIAENDKQFYSFILLLIAYVACYILMFNLLIHVVLRGLWIGALGLRYVSGDIKFNELNYHNRFTKYLRKKIVSFDRYVATLENYCSIMFAVSFLLIFYVISITLVIIAIVGVATYIISNDNLPKDLRTFIGIILLVFIGIGAILTFIDFITQGFLKKKKWVSKIYFPFYWVFSYLTLSILYRPLVYNFLDNKFTKRISFVLIPIYIAITIFSSIKYQKSNYIDYIKYNSSLYLNSNNYDDLNNNDTKFIKKASIQSKVITQPYINFFRVFTENIENRIYNFSPSIKPKNKNDQRGFTTDLKFSTDTPLYSRKKRDSLAKKYLENFNTIHHIQIDTIVYKPTFLLSYNKHKQIGFQTFLPTKKLSDGKHILKLKRKKILKNKDTVIVTDITIPFWYYKN